MRRVNVNDEGGQVLVMVLGYLILVGVTIAGLVGLVATHMGSKNQLRLTRGNAYAAPAAAENALAKVRASGACPASATVVAMDAAFVYDGASMQASYTCTSTPNGIITLRDIVLMACRVPSPAGVCTSATRLVTVTARYMDLPGNTGALANVETWDARY
jgi:hypothetical protein